MAYTSQFKIYSSSDVSHPVLNTASSGSLLALMNACLITGYGSMPGAGWTKTGSLVALPDSQSCGIFVMPTGSRATLFVNDAAPGVGGVREARLIGWDTVTTMSVAGLAGTNTTATGSNQFPTVAQLAIGQGAVTARKSTDLSATERQWVLFADSSSVYAYISTGDTAGMYYAFMFGDIYSAKSGSADTYKAILIGGIAEAAAGTVANQRLDGLSLVNAVTTGHFLQRSFSGFLTGVTAGKHGDGNKGSPTLLIGITQYPNGADNGFYISPVWVHENTNSTIRGKMRGFWHVLHALGSFSDGQTFTGTGDFAGRTFMVIKQSANAGVYLMETSNTLETN